MLAPEYKCNKDYELGRSNHFSIIIEDERQDQNTIEEAYSCLNKIILQVTEMEQKMWKGIEWK